MKDLELENARLKYWLKEIIRFYEGGSPAHCHSFSLRQAKKLLVDMPSKPIEKGCGDDYPVIEPQTWKKD